MATANTPTAVNAIDINAPSVESQETKTDPRRWIILALLALGAIIAFVSRTNISAALTLPSFIKFFNLTDLDRGLLNSAFFWSYAALQIPTGWIVDRYGVKYPYAISFVIWCLASAATGMAHTIVALTTLRVITGAGEAIVTPASYRWMRNNFKENESGLAVGVYMLGTKIGPAIGAPLAVWLIQLYNWPLMFYILGLAGLLWLVPWFMLVKSDRPKDSEAVGRAKKAAAIPLANIFASPVVWGTIIINFCYNYFVFFCMTWMPAYLVERRHLSLSKMGLYTFFSFSGIAIVALLAGWAADLMIKRGMDAVKVRKAFVVGGFAIACTQLLGATASSLNVALFWAVVSLSGLGLATANHLALCRLTLIPAGAVGLVAGIQNVSTSIAGIVSPLLSGWLKQTTGGYTAPMQVIFFFLVLGGVTCIVLLRREWAPKVPVTV
jgi:ACS family D-galactonate transporter-like MFS transporter